MDTNGLDCGVVQWTRFHVVQVGGVQLEWCAGKGEVARSLGESAAPRREGLGDGGRGVWDLCRVGVGKGFSQEGRQLCRGESCPVSNELTGVPAGPVGATQLCPRLALAGVLHNCLLWGGTGAAPAGYRARGHIGSVG